MSPSCDGSPHCHPAQSTKCHIQASQGHVQGWELHHLPGQPLPRPGRSRLVKSLLLPISRILLKGLCPGGKNCIKLILLFVNIPWLSAAPRLMLWERLKSLLPLPREELQGSSCKDIEGPRDSSGDPDLLPASFLPSIPAAGRAPCFILSFPPFTPAAGIALPSFLSSQQLAEHLPSFFLSFPAAIRAPSFLSPLPAAGRAPCLLSFPLSTGTEIVPSRSLSLFPFPLPAHLPPAALAPPPPSR